MMLYLFPVITTVPPWVTPWLLLLISMNSAGTRSTFNGGFDVCLQVYKDPYQADALVTQRARAK